MMLNRQKKLLALLDAHQGELDNMDFQKLLFLYCQEVETKPSYDFVPYGLAVSPSRPMRISAASWNKGFSQITSACGS